LVDERNISFLEKKGGKALFKEVFSLMLTKYGVLENTFWNYLRDLRLAGKIEYNDIYMEHMGPGDITITLKG